MRSGEVACHLLEEVPASERQSGTRPDFSGVWNSTTGEPVERLSSGEKVIVRLAMDVWTGRGFWGDVAQLDRARARRVLSELSALLDSLPP